MGKLKRIRYNAETKKYEAIDELSETKRTNLVYETETKMVYTRFSDKAMFPYITENGKRCRLIDGRLVEIS